MGAFKRVSQLNEHPKSNPEKKNHMSIRLPGSETRSSLHNHLTTASGKSKKSFSKESTHQKWPRDQHTSVYKIICRSVQDKIEHSACLVWVPYGSECCWDLLPIGHWAQPPKQRENSILGVFWANYYPCVTRNSHLFTPNSCICLWIMEK